MTELTSGAITAVDTVTIELGEADETPAIIIVRMACQGNRLSPAPFRSGANTAARVFAAAVVKLAKLRREQRL
jgi:hypothetical protein